MADKKISELTNIIGTDVSATDEFVVVDASAVETKAITMTELRSAVGNANFTVTGNITVTGTVDGRDIATDGTKLDGIEAGATGDQTANEILTALLTVDGASSTLDADLLDGQEGSYYTGYTDTAIANLIDTAPSTLDTLNELAAALGDDANFSTTVTNSIATKLALAGGTMTGDITFAGTQLFDGRDVSADGSKLDGIEVGATADQTAQEIATAIDADATAEATLKSALGLGTAAYTASTDYATAAQGSNADTAYGWGDHASAGYLTSYTETDPIYTASTWYTTTNNSANWDAAYAWGDHAAAGYTDEALALAIALG